MSWRLLVALPHLASPLPRLRALVHERLQPRLVERQHPAVLGVGRHEAAARRDVLLPLEDVQALQPRQPGHLVEALADLRVQLADARDGHEAARRLRAVHGVEDGDLRRRVDVQHRHLVPGVALLLELADVLAGLVIAGAVDHHVQAQLASVLRHARRDVAALQVHGARRVPARGIVAGGAQLRVLGQLLLHEVGVHRHGVAGAQRVAVVAQHARLARGRTTGGEERLRRTAIARSVRGDAHLLLLVVAEQATGVQLHDDGMPDAEQLRQARRLLTEVDRQSGQQPSGGAVMDRRALLHVRRVRVSSRVPGLPGR